MADSFRKEARDESLNH